MSYCLDRNIECLCANVMGVCTANSCPHDDYRTSYRTYMAYTNECIKHYCMDKGILCNCANAYNHCTITACINPEVYNDVKTEEKETHAMINGEELERRMGGLKMYTIDEYEGERLKYNCLVTSYEVLSLIDEMIAENEIKK